MNTPHSHAQCKPVAYTAAQIAAAAHLSKQTVLKSLAGIPATQTVIVRENKTRAWTVQQLPARLLKRLDIEATRQHCLGLTEIHRVQVLLSIPRERWELKVPLGKIDDSEIQKATKLRDALLPWLTQQHGLNLTAEKMAALAVLDYKRIVGDDISKRQWQRKFARTVERDSGAEDFQRLEIYLPERIKQKPSPSGCEVKGLGRNFDKIEHFIANCGNPGKPDKNECAGIWTLVMKKHAALKNAGASEKSASRLVREFLIARASFLARSPHALRMAFDRKLARWKEGGQDVNALRDGRANNGDHPDYPSADIRRVRHSAVLKNGKRIDAAWREEYPKLSDYTRQQHPCSRRCPRAFYQLVNREKVDALFDRLQGKRKLRRRIGGVTRSIEGLRSMDCWVMDDMTSNIEVSRRDQDGTLSLIQPQIIVPMDLASGFIPGLDVSDDKAPTATGVCASFLDGVRLHGVPDELRLENGFTFGKSLNVNGKVDEQGRTLVAGLAQYGCTIHHFDPMSPTSKGELEKAFDLIQRRMERHPGYTGRNQMLDASEEFKREQRLIRSGKVDADKFRYTFDEFVRVLRKLIAEYNDEPQYGRLKGLSPRECFEALKDSANPPIKFDNRLHWILANERYRVRVGAGGVTFRHYGRKIQVRGGELAKMDRIGTELWALIDRKDDSMVTFMTLDYRQTFTVETCRNPSADESRIASCSGVLASELGKIGEHMRTVNTEFTDLKAEYGNPRQDLLAQIRGETTALSSLADGTTRRTIINSRIEASAEQMNAQRAAITAKRRHNAANKNRARRQGITTELVDDDEQSRRGLELLSEPPASAAGEVEISERNEL